MKKVTTDTLINLALLITIALIVFTPLGFYPRVFASRLLSFSPSIIDMDEQLKLSDYNWELESATSEIFEFNSTKNKVVVVNFWATWCPPCVAEMPSLNTLYESYGDRVEFVFVAHDEKEKVFDFLTKEKYDLPVYFENSTAPAVLASKNIPTTYIIDRDGNIVVKKTGAANWNSQKTQSLIDGLLENN